VYVHIGTRFAMLTSEPGAPHPCWNVDDLHPP
jgi:hypothetical protein